MNVKRRRWNKIQRLVSHFRGPVATLNKEHAQTLGEMVGFDPEARLLIVHADDLGIAQAVNNAFITGLATGLINSGSVMVPGRWFSEVATFAQAHPDADLGLHLTLTSEGPTDRGRPVAPRAQIPSLVDYQGRFLESWTSETPINPRDVEIELRAQIEKAFTSGLRPTHLDSHQFGLQMRGRELFDVYLGLGHEYRLPVLVTREWFSRFPYLDLSLTKHDVVLDRVITINAKVTPDQWPAFYRSALGKLPPGVTEFLIHPGHDDEELRTLFEDRPDWGAEWRQRDFDFFISNEFRGLLAQYNIKLITWREITTRLR